MSTESPSDGSEDVKEFLRRIKELGDKREKEDEERTKKLEQDILEGRRQREARRAERARSLSPEKQSPSGTPQSLRSPRATARNDILPSSPPNLAVSPDTAHSLAPIAATLAQSPSTEETLTAKASSHQEAPASYPAGVNPAPNSSLDFFNSKASPVPARANTLSWQQRPSSFDRNTRPLSVIEKQSPLPQEVHDDKLLEDNSNLSRIEIAQKLASKDPSWFRQTPDRGVGSAAFRKSSEDGPVIQGGTTGRMRLHGLSKEATNVSEIASSTNTSSLTTKTLLPEVESISRNELMDDQPLNASSTVQETSEREQPQLPSRASQKLPVVSNEESGLSSGPGRATNERQYRPASPTKGLGGFVQSAMLKRSDSITKRGNIQNSSGYNLQSPAATPQKTQNVTLESTEPFGATQQELQARKGIMEQPNSRPGSRDSDKLASSFPQVKQGIEDKSGNSPATLPAADLSKDGQSEGVSEYSKELPSPPSPSKRWSPAKSSWVESALNKPETPKHKPGNSQPIWMAELNRGKQNQVSRDLGPTTTPAQGDMRQADTPTQTARKAETDETSISQSITAKTNPVTPPKKTISSSSKGPETTPDRSSKEQLEFQNVFGKLRRTQTEKYVAPDDFKNNILRGKAALNQSDGPQKTPRKDEFKESLIQQKESMKAKPSSSKATDSGSGLSSQALSGSQNPTIPEAIAKRRALGSQSSNIQAPPIVQKPSNLTTAETSRSTAPSAKTFDTQREEVKAPPNKLAINSATGSSKLANRFNPGLANIIARGPPSTEKGSNSSGTKASTSSGYNSKVIDSNSDGAAPTLQHMTKHRARGPKRRTPKAADTVVKSEASVVNLPDDTSVPSLNDSLDLVLNKDEEQSTKDFVRSNARIVPLNPSKQVSSGLTAPESSPISQRSTLSISRSPPVPSKPSKLTETFSESDQKSWTQASSGNDGVIKSPVKKAVDVWDTPTQSSSLKSGLDFSAENTKPRVLATAESNRKPQSQPQLDSGRQGLGLNLNSERKQPFVVSEKKETSTDRTHGRNVVEKDNITAEAKHLSAKPNEPGTSPIPQTSEAGRLFSEFFGDIPIDRGNLNIDSSMIPSSQHTRSTQTKTIGKQIHELTSDGKMVTLPSQQEHILYSRSIYLCTHVFGSPDGGPNVTEVYLWIGREVPAAAAEDSQIFARKAAKDNNGTLVKFSQGKETEGFLQAIGGIIVTRFGDAKNQSDSYMLCGRQHLDHMAFDEVQSSLKSLCSGFPFIISSGTGKLYLWKGAGCNAEELGCARLISMDLQPNSSVIEVDEGSETKEFLSLFSTTSNTAIKSANFWKLKPKHENYNVRLFHVECGPADSKTNAFWQRVSRTSQPDLTSPNQTRVNEIVPFCQEDLSPENIYVLDAFFEIYLILGSRSSSKPQSFLGALNFAQEYGILAASSDDRPFVPVSTVVLEGAPKDMRSVFRSWSVDETPKRGRSLRIVPLSAAIAATKAG